MAAIKLFKPVDLTTIKGHAVHIEAIEMNNPLLVFIGTLEIGVHVLEAAWTKGGNVELLTFNDKVRPELADLAIAPEELSDLSETALRLDAGGMK
ncbi:hypothetical protein [Hyphomicrobium sp. DY-1]|uniref:hypothetical protein n=1 Tax=Hyphomicrobium sp. DY-1 TaxID=3075650 RepID=UPI0039C04637